MERFDIDIEIGQDRSLVGRVLSTGFPAIAICGTSLLFSSIILDGSRLVLVVTLLGALLVNWLYSSYRMNQYLITSLNLHEETLTFRGVKGSKPINGKYSLEELSFSIVASNNFPSHYILQVRDRKNAKVIFRQHEKNGWTKEMLGGVIAFIKSRKPSAVERRSLTIL